MGLDYIRRQTGRPWRKRWRAGLDRLNLPTLLDMQFRATARTIIADLRGQGSLRVGNACIIEMSDEGLRVTDGLTSIGLARDPSEDLLAGIAASEGCAEGVVEYVSIFGDIAEIRLR